MLHFRVCSLKEPLGTIRFTTTISGKIARTISEVNNKLAARMTTHKSVRVYGTQFVDGFYTKIQFRVSYRKVICHLIRYASRFHIIFRRRNPNVFYFYYFFLILSEARKLLVLQWGLFFVYKRSTGKNTRSTSSWFPVTNCIQLVNFIWIFFFLFSSFPMRIIQNNSQKINRKPFFSN